MEPSHTTLSGQLLHAIEQARHCLSAQFATEFSVWMVGEDGLQDVARESPDNQDTELLHQSIQRWREQSEPQDGVSCWAIQPDMDLVVRTITVNPSLRMLVAGIVRQDRRQLLAQFAKSALERSNYEAELRDARSCLAEYADQVTNDFEELAWLRGLADRIEVCDSRNDLRTICETVLPPLRELISAEAIAWIRNTEAGESETGYECGYVAGELPLDMQTCGELVAQCDSSAGQPVVRNAETLNAPSDRTFGLRNFILVRISRGGSLFGWLLVANRAVLGSSPDDLRVNASCLSGWEFGTFEAGLVNEAGTLLATHARNAQLFHEREDLLLGVMRALINAVDAKDAYTCGHSDRVAMIARHIARQLALPSGECERIYMTGLLHDIGKIGIPDEVLCKPGKLTTEEYDIIKQHPAIGYSILRHVKQLQYVLPGVLHHHECYDGTGYPHGLAGEDIPLYGRVLAVADAYDAMTSTRSYRRAMAPDKAQSILRAGAGSQWDANIVNAFFDAYPEIEAICEDQHPSKLLADSAERYCQHVDEPWDALSAAFSALELTYE